MKGILCISCVDFKALDPDPKHTVFCRCGNVKGAWTDPVRGRMRIGAIEREYARVIGIHNQYLGMSVSIPAHSDFMWREMLAKILDESEGYLFHSKRRNSPFLLIRVGESSDVVWWEDYVEPEKADVLEW